MLFFTVIVVKTSSEVSDQIHLNGSDVDVFTAVLNDFVYHQSNLIVIIIISKSEASQ